MAGNGPAGNTVSVSQLQGQFASNPGLFARVFDSGNIGNVAGIHTLVGPGDLLLSGLFEPGGALTPDELRGLAIPGPPDFTDNILNFEEAHPGTFITYPGLPGPTSTGSASSSSSLLWIVLIVLAIIFFLS